MTRKQKKVLYRIIIAAVLIIGLHFVPVEGYIRLALYMIPYLVIGYDILKKAFKGIIHGAVFDENFLMAIATVGAILLGEYTEGVAVMLFYQIGELFQSVAVGKSRKNIAALMDIRPDYANLIQEDGSEEKVDPDDVEIGSFILVRPGERIPLDGVIVEGTSTLNTAALTGESVPRNVSEGEEVISGCVNLTGVLKIRTTKVYGESTVSRILELVENSGMKKSKSENFITKFAKYYTPAVCFGALALAALPPICLVLMGKDQMVTEWITRALTFLVISCPCALVISIPLSFFGGIGAASANGILVKGSNYLEALSQTKYVVFDKTGTLTQGVFQVTGIYPSKNVIDRVGSKMEAEALVLETAALLESYSNHPISKSLKEAYSKEIDTKRIDNVEEIGGHGVTATLDGHKAAAGNHRLLQKLGIEIPDANGKDNTSGKAENKAATIVHVVFDDLYLGHIEISDVIRPQSKETIENLHMIGINKTIMLTGDHKKVADEVAGLLGIDEVHSELLPADKVSRVEQLLEAKNEKEKLAFVGDGINDAPVLSRVDIGIAMGALGSDAAIEAADVVLMDDNPLKISKKCLRVVYQNIVFALGVKGLCLILGALGIANMWMAIFADVGVMVLAVLNAMRCLRIKKA